MKKKYFSAALAVPALTFLLFSFSGGPNNAVSGSPGDGETCTKCHNTNLGNFNAQASIIHNIPETGYELNTKYQITVSAGSSTSNKHGFQMVAEEGLTNSKVGVFTPGSGMRTTEGGARIMHSSPLFSSKTWTFEWTSPSNDVGPITFYTAVNAANGSSASGDQIVTANSKIESSISLGVSEYFESQFNLYPNPASGHTNLELPADVTNATVIVYDYLGKKVKYQEVNQVINKIDLQGLAAGVYYMSINTGSGDLSKTIVIK